MKKLFVISCLFLAVKACGTDGNARQDIEFYHRDKLGAWFPSYSDYLAISNYERQPATARQLLQLANSYLDTAHAKLSIEGITLMAKDIEAPKLNWDSEIFGQERKYFLITFDYVHSSFDTVNRKKQLNSIVIWKHAEPIMYYQHYFYFHGKLTEGRNLIDSILNSTEPLLTD